MKQLKIATRNSGKVAEIRRLVAALPDAGEWSVIGVADAETEPEETGETFEANAALKALAYDANSKSVWTLADDSGLEVDALQGRPGVHSSRYAPTDPERISRLLGELEGVGEAQRTARFVCALAVAHEGRVVWTGRGTVEGRIADAPRGTNGFGYDPVFWLPERGCTMAELGAEEKNGVSHRGEALRHLAKAWKELAHR